MKQLFIILLSAVLFLPSCESKKEHYTKAEDALDAGREFVDGCLKGNFIKANFYMLQDNVNKGLLNDAEKAYRQNSREQRQQYREASINIVQTEYITEDTTLIHYSNSYDKVVRKIKVLKQNDNWLVDFKYTFNPNL